MTNSLFRCPPPPQRWTGPGHHGPRGQLVAPTVVTTARGRAPPRRRSTGVVTAPATTSLQPTAPAACVAVSMATVPSVCRPPLIPTLAAQYVLKHASYHLQCQSSLRSSVISSECQSALQRSNKPLRHPSVKQAISQASRGVDESLVVFLNLLVVRCQSLRIAGIPTRLSNACSLVAYLSLLRACAAGLSVPFSLEHFP